MTAVSSELRSKSQPRRGLRRVEAAIYIGVSPSKWDEMVGDGRMPQPKVIDGVRSWDIRRVDLAYEALPDASGAAATSSWD